MTDKESIERLIALLNGWGISQYIPHHTAIAMLADYLISSGVIVPPCIEGTTVYRIYKKCSGSMQCLYNGGYGIWRCHYKNECRCDGFVDEIKFEFCMLKEVGKTVFLTKEEAEKALAERNAR